MVRRLAPAAILLAALASAALADDARTPAIAGGSADEDGGCAACHQKLHPGIVSDWRLSKHARQGVGCAACHGRTHTSEADRVLAVLPTVETCQRCHEKQATQFRRGKHARAWAAVKALPTFHHLRPADPEEVSGCAVCHRIGLKTDAEAEALKRTGANHGQASCDACHTRHLFSALEARQPEACRTCHDSLQYDAWASSKHGTRHVLKASGRLPSSVAAPVCQDCHMPDGDHANRTPWGNLGLRLPHPEDPAWAADRETILVALGALDGAGGYGPRYPAMHETGMIHLDREAYQQQRYKLVQACRSCHAMPFIREQLDRRDRMLRQSDALTAAALRQVVALYADGVLKREGPGPLPDLVRAPLGPPIEQRLAAMFFDHRARLMATAFHMSQEWPTWMSALEGDFVAIDRMADELRARPGAKKGKTAGPKKR